IGDVAFEIAMLVALRDPRAIHGQHSALTAAAVTRYSEFSRAIRTRDKLPSGSVTLLAILKRHPRTSIRACAANGKPRCMWICVKEKAPTISVSSEAVKKLCARPGRMGLSFISSRGCALEQWRAATASHLKRGWRRGKAPAEPRLQIRSFVFPFRAFSRACSE